MMSIFSEAVAGSPLARRLAACVFAASAVFLAVPAAAQPRGDSQLTLGIVAAPNAKRPEGTLNTLADLSAMLRACWKPPAAENAYRGMQMTMRFAFNRSGALMGEPQLTYATDGVPKHTRDLYRDALARSLQACAPLSLSDALGGAIAGRPMSLRIVDDRKDGGKNI